MKEVDVNSESGMKEWLAAAPCQRREVDGKSFIIPLPEAQDSVKAAQERLKAA